jgi:hypothetical protein
VNLTLRRSTAVAVVLLAPLLSSCGFDRPTDRVYNPGVGVNDRSGTVDVLGAVVVASRDGSGTVVATFVNNDPDRADALTRIAGSGQDAGISVSLGSPVDIKPGGSAQISTDTAVTASGAGIKQGAFVELTFAFRRGQSVTMQVPVVARRGDYADVPTGSASPSESPSPTS